MIKCRDPKLGPGSTLTEEERGAFAGVDGSPNPQKLPELNKRDDEKQPKRFTKRVKNGYHNR